MKPIAGILLLIAFVCVLSLACKKENTDLPKPLKELTETLKNCSCQPFIDRHLWKSRVVYVSSCGGPACFCAVSYYDESGNSLSLETGYGYAEFLKESTSRKTVWQCK